MTVQSIGANAQKGANRAGGMSGNGVSRGTIVVLDDDLLFRGAITRALVREGYDVFEVENPAELREVLENSPIDLIVADSRLADGSDGWLEAKALADAYEGVRLLAVTGYGPDAIRAVGGYTDVEFVTKEGSGFNIVAAVERALARE